MKKVLKYIDHLVTAYQNKSLLVVKSQTIQNQSYDRSGKIRDGNCRPCQAHNVDRILDPVLSNLVQKSGLNNDMTTAQQLYTPNISKKDLRGSSGKKLKDEMKNVALLKQELTNNKSTGRNKVNATNVHNMIKIMNTTKRSGSVTMPVDTEDILQKRANKLKKQEIADILMENNGNAGFTRKQLKTRYLKMLPMMSINHTLCNIY